MISVMLGSASSASRGPKPRTSSRTESMRRSLSVLVIVIAVVRKYSSASYDLFPDAGLVAGVDLIGELFDQLGVDLDLRRGEGRAHLAPASGDADSGRGGARGQARRGRRRLDRGRWAGDRDSRGGRVRSPGRARRGPVRGRRRRRHPRLVLLDPVEQAHLSYRPDARANDPGPRSGRTRRGPADRHKFVKWYLASTCFWLTP